MDKIVVKSYLSLLNTLLGEEQIPPSVVAEMCNLKDTKHLAQLIRMLEHYIKEHTFTRKPQVEEDEDLVN